MAENQKGDEQAAITDSDREWFQKKEPEYAQQFTEMDNQMAEVLDATAGATTEAETTETKGEVKAPEESPSESEDHSDEQTPGSHDGEGDGTEDGSHNEPSPIYQKALDALRRGLPESMHTNIDSMSREEVLEAGISMAYSQAEQDAVGSRLGRLEKGTDSRKAEKDSGDVDAGSPEPRSEEFDPTAVLEPYDLELNPEDLPAALADVMKAAVKHTKDTLRAETQKGDGDELSTLKGEFESYKIDQAGRQLEGRFPQLRDAKHMADVQKKMRQIEPAMEYSDGASAHAKTLERMELACGLTFGHKAAQPGKKEPGKRNQPPKPSRTPASKKTADRSQHDKDWAFFNEWEKTGGNVEQAKKAYRGN